ncbi:PREDICTED: serine/threonine-protein kinase TNNI3K-like [Amphimedon queenslandica]|nr:PREDICTED: serine/threonine-protein kinase TNNI3K-like [Amphimedon queenslandica]|eukprot:XP_019857708.1 PREDICTED: serine/threonine-protein kinase TNNI3K-like [Amphimedon queenslandica]
MKDYKCSLSLTDKDGNNVSHFSSMLGHIRFIKHLVENHQLDLCAVNDEGMAPIHLACSNGRLNLIQYIIEHKPSSLELPHSKYGHTPFLIAVYFNKLEVIKYLISKKCNLSATDDEGSGAVHISVERGHLNVLKYLIDNNYCNPNATNHQDRTPLHLAVLADQFETIKYLMCESISSISMVWLREIKYSLDGPHNINIPDGLPVDVNTKDKDGITCLHLIAEKGNIKMYEYLKYHYKSIPRDNFGRSPLHYSCLSNKYDMAMYLVKSCHYDPDDTDNNGYNSVHAACQVGNFELALYFLTEHGCNPWAETNDEQTLLYFAIKSSNSELIQLLKQAIGLRPRWHETEADEPISSEFRSNPENIYQNITSDNRKRKAKNRNKCLLS